VGVVGAAVGVVVGVATGTGAVGVDVGVGVPATGAGEAGLFVADAGADLWPPNARTRLVTGARGVVAPVPERGAVPPPKATGAATARLRGPAGAEPERPARAARPARMAAASSQPMSRPGASDPEVLSALISLAGIDGPVNTWPREPSRRRPPPALSTSTAAMIAAGISAAIDAP
jgi:hypothetical protein